MSRRAAPSVGESAPRGGQPALQPCDRAPATRRSHCDPELIILTTIAALLSATMLLPEARASASSGSSSSIIIDQGAFSGAQLLPTSGSPSSAGTRSLPAHLQPVSVFGGRHRGSAAAINLTHLALDELTGSVYVGATNWLFQLSAASLRPDVALRTGPAAENPRDCAPSDCLVPLAHVDAAALPLHHAHPALDLGVAVSRRPALQTLNVSLSAAQRRSAMVSSGQQQQHNNYNKLLLVEPEARQLLVCGSLNQGACRKHQLGQVSNYSELVPLPVASNDELSSSVALITRRSGQHQQAPLLYVAATNSRLGPYRDQVPPISARYLEPANRAMQIIERSFTESARLDISSELRDYYLVNYVHTFQHQDFVYFATVQRKSPLRQLEEWGYITRLARLCLSDLSFQSYTELTLECKLGQVNYNLLQDAQLVSASSHLAQHLGIRPQSAVLIGAFALSRDHTTRTQPKSAVCLFPMDRIEQAFTDNIHLCFNGSAKARNMNYIAGAVNDCPKPGKAGNVANFCSEPLKLNGSLSLSSSPVLSYDDQLISALTATQAHTGALGAGSSATSGANLLPHLAQEQRSHQVLVLGTGEGALRRVALISAGATLRAHELDAVQLAQADQDQPQAVAAAEPVLADLLIQPAAAASGSGASDGPQFALAATPHRLVRLRINGCRASQVRSSTLRSTNNGSSTANLADECNACAHLQDPFCGWCATSGSCSTREECRQQQQVSGKPAHWAPFDQVQCAHYQPVWPQSVALQVSRQVSVDVNVPLAQPPSSHAQQAALGLQLAQAHFVCHFEYLASGATGAATNYSRRSASTRATQVRLNAHAASVSISCPLPPLHQRPASAQLPHEPPADQVRTRLTVRLANSPGVAADQMVAALALRSSGIERELSLYDCATHSTCRTCLGTGNTKRGHTCAWCPLSAKCTFDASDADLGCAAAAVSSTTPHSASGGPNGVRASHLAGSLDQAQASVFGIALHRPAQCPADDAQTERPAASKIAGTVGQPAGEILVHSGSRRAIQVNLRQPLPNGTGGRRKLECIFELEGAKMRVGARLLEANQQVVCQETALTYLEEVSTQRAQLSLILNEQQVIETSEVILYKCHLFGVSPPALTSSGGLQHSSAAWRAHELLQLADPQPAQLAAQPHRRRHAPLASDCSLCLNVERKYQCVWCKNQCLQAEQCSEMGASTTCPPPRIDSIQPTSGPLEGGTLLTIEGSNLGSNEREIQDKISVGGEPCQLVMYSVSTRIVCKTGPSLHGPQAATVFVGNRAGVTSAQEKFHYKAVHLTDVKPNIGPVSGGTRLTLSGSNLNVGSRLQVFLDDIPCALDSNAASSNQITCVTAPNLLATSMRITRLTLMLDNSTHHLPYPFTYQPDPIITSIEPAESFVSGGRLIVLVGQHLNSPQSVKLMVYHEQRHSLINGTSCFTQNDTHITCLTPAMPELLSLSSSASTTTATSFGEDFQSLSSSALDTQVQQHQSTSNPLSRNAGGVKLKMSFFMDDVRSVRNLDEYYHHLPHYLTYFEDPRLYRLSTPVVEYTPELVISGENLDMPDLDQDIHVTIGNQVCLFKSYNSNQIVCSPPVQVMSLVERPILPIVAVIGTNIKYDIGYMQYNSNNIIRSQPPLFAQLPHDDPNNNIMSSFSSSYQPVNPYSGSRSEPSTSSPSTSSGVAILVSLSIVGFLVGLVATLMFALSRFRQSKAEREYKRIQLQMGSLDINGQPMGGNIFENIHINNAAQQTGAGSRALNYVGGAFAGKKLFYQLNQQLPSFPPSPLTDISSLTGSNPMAYNQHVVKLSSNGTIMNSTAQQPQQHHYNSATNSNNSSQSSPGSTRNSSNLFNQSQQSNGFSNQQQHHLQHHQQQLFNNSNHDKSNLLTINGTQANTRNFNWTQEAPSTIVPYAVIEACNLTLEGKNAIKEFV